ncbi:protein kinase kinase kinase [Seminavis robusta]|uniref:Protein kinase kinase kinase n=1 Tax=Seminavis robusta TaxID=568900 RepID=A0A9N8EWJ3_9STRA|nr:protein kinase kinase kinase [Seminavis robusta]|eukprot:Sro1814_g299340.1 protein kinase kinase kinase (915) ;mRNA; f:10619-13363
MVVSLAAQGPEPGSLTFKGMSSPYHRTQTPSSSSTDPEAAPATKQQSSAPSASTSIKRMNTDERKRSSLAGMATLARVMTKLSNKVDASRNRLRNSSRSAGAHGEQMRRAALSARRTRSFFNDPQARLKAVLSPETAPFLSSRLNQLMPTQVYRLQDFDFNLNKVLEDGEFYQTHEAVFSRQRSNPQSRKHPYRIKFIHQTVIGQSDEDEVALERAATKMMTEGLYLAHLSHLNIIKLRGVNSGGLSSLQHEQPENFFFLTDRLGETLPQRLETWKKWATALEKMERRRRNRAKYPAPLVPKTGESSAQTILRDKSIRTYPEDVIVLKTNYALQILHALSYLHERRIVVRELRPEAIGFCAYPHHHTVQLIDLTSCREIPKEQTSIPPEPDWQSALRPNMRTLIMPDVSHATNESSRCLSPVAEDDNHMEGFEIIHNPIQTADFTITTIGGGQYSRGLDDSASVGQSVDGSSLASMSTAARHLKTVTEEESSPQRIVLLTSSNKQSSDTSLRSSLNVEDLMMQDVSMMSTDEHGSQRRLRTEESSATKALQRDPPKPNNNNKKESLGGTGSGNERRKNMRPSFLTAERQFSLHSLAPDTTTSDEDSQRPDDTENSEKQTDGDKVPASDSTFMSALGHATWNPSRFAAVEDDESTTNDEARSLPPRAADSMMDHHHTEDKSSGSTNTHHDGNVFGVRTTVMARRYIAPELFGGIKGAKQEGYDTQADIYSWAMIFTELLTENRPYSSRQLTRDWHRVVAGKLRPNIQKYHYPRVVKGVVEQAWQARPDKRGTAEQLSKSMERILLMLEGRSKPWDKSAKEKEEFQREKNTTGNALDLLRKSSAEDVAVRNKAPTLPERASKYKRWMAREPQMWTDLWDPRSKRSQGDEEDIMAEIQGEKQGLFAKKLKQKATPGI